MTQYKKGSLLLNFRLDNLEFCILSDYIESIEIPKKIDPLPHTTNTLAGVTGYGKEIIPVVEMREVFGKMNLKKCVEEFGIMKDMHISWVDDLKRYVNEGGEFTKAVNPHACKFGLWYDSFRTDNSRLLRLLNKINGPHEQIHRCGAEILTLKSKGAGHEAEIQALLEQAENICYDDIVPLLNRLIDIYHSANRGVLLIVNKEGGYAALLVDEVKSLIPCSKVQRRELNRAMSNSACLENMILDGDRILLEINVNKILSLG